MRTRGERQLAFALRDDWATLLSSLEQEIPVKYVESGMLSLPTRVEYPTFADIPKFAEASWDDAIQEARYLVIPEDIPLNCRSVVLNNGKQRFVADHENNPESVILAPGGLFEKERAVIQGEVSKLSTRASTQQIFALFAKLFRRQFLKVGPWRVGPKALLLKRSGYRLTAGVKNPIEYDLPSLPS